ncbi:hypothetical protein RhiLY_11783 [Ceratobasidium sp. AG-Ba]|nr:hypothetical protein RhiLY_11783 [Ceratobasidium sp. AG-Ba]
MSLDTATWAMHPCSVGALFFAPLASSRLSFASTLKTRVVRNHRHHILSGFYPCSTQLAWRRRTTITRRRTIWSCAHRFWSIVRFFWTLADHCSPFDRHRAILLTPTKTRLASFSVVGLVKYSPLRTVSPVAPPPLHLSPGALPRDGSYSIPGNIKIEVVTLAGMQFLAAQRIFPTDTIFNRATVAALTILTVLQGTMDYINLYRCAVKYYGDFTMFDEQDCKCCASVCCTDLIGFKGLVLGDWCHALIGTVAQIFFLERCYSATKKQDRRHCRLARDFDPLGFGIASSVEFQRIVHLSLVPEIPVPIIGWLTATAVLDVLISAILIYSCVSRRLSATVITKIIRVTAETSTVTASIAVINLVVPCAPWACIPSPAAVDHGEDVRYLGHDYPQLAQGPAGHHVLASDHELLRVYSWPCRQTQVFLAVVVVTTSYQQNVDDTKSHGHDIELGTRTVDTVRFARQDDINDDDESLDAGKRSHHPFAP